MQITFKDNFLKRYNELTDLDTFKEITIKELRKSIRVNNLKISVEEIKERFEEKWSLEQVPWCNEGFFISGARKDIGNLIEHSLGYIYIQEAASMIPPMVLNPCQDDIILDMAASPGSKTTQIAAMMQNKGLIVANDITGDRIKLLGFNIQKSGISNTIITQMNGMQFKNFQFDKVLLDAPCSGTGAIRKSLRTLQIYNTKMITKLASVQKRLIFNAFNNLKPDGTLVYSTCSLEPEENESVVNSLLTKFNEARLEKIEIDLKRSNPVLEFEKETYSNEIKKCLRLWPQDNNTEGFFVAKIKKV